ncbi:hypothetical protein F5B22DRAFT_564425 [Xylaria bambusicola]|uniref:uncharacterized protein n=1 Tax=Xylaria bambusicola TaxID=326684 RepID=UPI002008E2BA|nr:uncharacterized protein F5B22DRAFT_564425 [Xylaria bambusicola]KAI0503127.1 hypothetical protein F5B22DRAFT_564425 [Xylaria bambusicola]
MLPAQTPQVDHSRVPALATAEGHVLTNGLFQCTATRAPHGVSNASKTCGSTMENNKKNIRSHLNKLHTHDSSYAKSQAGFAKANHLEQFVCDRPRLDGSGWCTRTRWGQHSLVAHAREEHKFRGKSESLSTPWAALSDKQRTYYLERVELEKRRLQNDGVYTLADEELSKQFKEEKFPEA